MKKLLVILALFCSISVSAQQAPTPVAPLNATGVATSCDNVSVQCTYTDVAVSPGKHFYFIVAANANGYSSVSNKIDVTVSSGTHNAVLTWSPSATTSPAVSYFIYRGAPPTNLGIISVQ
jgi:hypothetical protein